MCIRDRLVVTGFVYYARVGRRNSTRLCCRLVVSLTHCRRWWSGLVKRRVIWQKTNLHLVTWTLSACCWNNTRYTRRIPRIHLFTSNDCSKSLWLCKTQRFSEVWYNVSHLQKCTEVLDGKFSPSISVQSNDLWKSAGKARQATIFNNRQTSDVIFPNISTWASIMTWNMRVYKQNIFRSGILWNG